MGHPPLGPSGLPPGHRSAPAEPALRSSHARALALLILREAEGTPYLEFFPD